MNVPTLLTMAVLVGWLATLITHAETDDVSLPDFAIAVCAAALAGGLLAPVLGISATGEFGFTLSGTLFSWACATLVLGTLNLLRFGSLRRNRRAGAPASHHPPQVPSPTRVIDGARGRSRTDTLLKAADFPATSAFAAPGASTRSGSWSGARLHRGLLGRRCPPSALYTFLRACEGLARHQLELRTAKGLRRV